MAVQNIREILASSQSALGRRPGRRIDPTPLRARPVLGYCRFSTRGQHETSIEKQQEFIASHAKGKDMRPPRFFNDRGVSGVTDDRAAWKELVSWIRPGTIVIVHEITRLARDTLTALNMIRQVQLAGGEVDIINIGTTDNIYLTIMAAVAEYDYHSVITRMRDGRVQAVAMGFPLRKPAYGYTKTERDFLICEAEAYWVREIFKMRLEGASYGQIVRFLVRSGAPTKMGGQWHSCQVSTILHAPLYGGYLVQKRPIFAWEKRGSFPNEEAQGMPRGNHGRWNSGEGHELDGASDPFNSATRTRSVLTDDVIVTHVPHLAIVSWEDFKTVLAMRGAPRQKNKPVSNHPLRGKWRCPRCGRHNLRFAGKLRWLRCSGVNPPGLGHALGFCDAPPIDLEKAETLMFKALETLSPAHKGKFSITARERYEEIVAVAKADRQQKKESAGFLRSKIRMISLELAREQTNHHVRTELTAEVNRLSAELDDIEAHLQDMPAEILEPDPTESLLELDNMIEELKSSTPFGFTVNPDALQFSKRLKEIIVAVNMVEKGDDVYDVEFEFNVSAALGQSGKVTEKVRFADVNLHTGRFRSRRRRSIAEKDWQEGKFAISDRAWKKRPSLPRGERFFGENLRWLVDTMIMLAETGYGTRKAVDIAGARHPANVVHMYRASPECRHLRNWLQEVRPRKHEYLKMKPKASRQLTLRERMQMVNHPLLDLARCKPSTFPSPLSDQEAIELISRLPNLHKAKLASLRPRMNDVIELLRTNAHEINSSKDNFSQWMQRAIQGGEFLVAVNFLRELEGLPPVAELPALPSGLLSKKALQ